MESTKENITACLKLVGRFQSLRYFNTLNDESKSILADALLTSCRNQEQAATLVDAWLSEHEEYPTAANINRLAREMNRGPEVVTLPSACDLCREIPGYIRTEITVKAGVFAGEKRDALALCICERGKALRDAALRFKRESLTITTAGDGYTLVGPLIPEKFKL
jgi:hypothetical protein